MHLVTCGQFQSHDKDGGHIIRSTISENRMLHTVPIIPNGSMFDKTGVIADRSFTLPEYGFSTFFAPVTLTLTRWPSYTNLTEFPGDIPGCAMQIWISYVRALESYRLTDRQTDRHDRNYIQGSFAGGQTYVACGPRPGQISQMNSGPQILGHFCGQPTATY